MSGASMGEPKAVVCSHCDFGSGHRGMDTCGKCDGSGSVFIVRTEVFPNTKDGYEGACEAINATFESLANALECAAKNHTSGFRYSQQVSSAHNRLACFHNAALSTRDATIAALRERVKVLEDALERINQRASPGGDRTFDETAAALYWCACEARRAPTPATEAQETTP